MPYLNRQVGPEIVAAMTVLGYEVKNVTGLRCGLQILAGANHQALAAALAAADALIIGSYFKLGGHWSRGVDFERVKIFMQKVNSLRSSP